MTKISQATKSKVQSIVGVILSLIVAISVLLYTNNLESKYRASAERSFAYFVVREVPEGTSLGEVFSLGFVEMREVLKESMPVNAFVDSSTGSQSDTFSNRDIPVGQVLLRSDFGEIQVSSSGLLIPDGNVVVSIRLGDVERIAPFLRPGNEVAVYATDVISKSGRAGTKVIVPRAKVLGVGDTRFTGTQDFVPSGDLGILTLALDADYAGVLIESSKTISLQLALLSRDTQVPNKLITPEEVFRKN